MVVVIIEADFAAGQDLRLVQKLVEFGVGSIISKPGFVRMDSSTGIDFGHARPLRVVSCRFTFSCPADGPYSVGTNFLSASSLISATSFQAQSFLPILNRWTTKRLGRIRRSKGMTK